MSIEDNLRLIVREELAPIYQLIKRIPQEDRLISVEEAAKVLTASKEWIYKNADTLPFVVKPQPNMVRVSYNKLQAWIAQKLKAQERGK